MFLISWVCFVHPSGCLELFIAKANSPEAIQTLESEPLCRQHIGFITELIVPSILGNHPTHALTFTEINLLIPG